MRLGPGICQKRNASCDTARAASSTRFKLFGSKPPNKEFLCEGLQRAVGDTARGDCAKATTAGRQERGGSTMRQVTSLRHPRGGERIIRYKTPTPPAPLATCACARTLKPPNPIAGKFRVNNIPTKMSTTADQRVKTLLSRPASAYHCTPGATGNDTCPNAEQHAPHAAFWRIGGASRMRKTTEKKEG